MKKLLLSCTIILIALSSCQKKYCWKCNTTTFSEITLSGSGHDVTTYDTVKTPFTLCDETEAQIKAVEKPTNTFRQVEASYISTQTTTTCNK